MLARPLAYAPAFVRCLGVSCVLLASAASLAGDGVPRALDGIVYSAGKRPVHQVTLHGVAFDSISISSDQPYLLWPSDADQPVPEAGDPEGLGRWLGGTAAELGFEGFHPRFVESFAWKDHEVLSYQLVRDGVVLHDAQVLVHRDAGGLLGIVIQVDGPIVAIDAPDLSVPQDQRVYFAVPTEGGSRAMSARAERARMIDRSVLRVVGPDGVVLEVEHTPDPVLDHRGNTPVFSEYVVPGGSFPDQISVAPDGVVWFSDPAINKLVAFDPLLEQFSFYPTTGGSGPDGMIVGTQGRVWTGMYYSGGLGVLDTGTGVFTEYPAPYGAAAMAIPVETTDGSVWVTDHQYNRISEFDPATETWIRSVVMPTGGCWVVQGHEDTSRGQVYFTEYSADKLGRIDLGGSVVTDIQTPGGGPAFCVYSADKVYYSRWSESGIGVYDVPSGTITEFAFPVANEWGGPMWIRPDGDIVIGTRNRGYIMVFHIATQAFSALEIPTGFAGLKDGMTVGADNTIWFTETGVNKLGKLEYCLNTCVADFNGDGEVDTLDVLAFLNAWSAGDPAADINDDGAVDTLDVLAFLNLWGAGC